MKQPILLFLLLVGVIIFTAWLQKGRTLPIPGIGGQPQNTMKVGDKNISVEIADSPVEHEKGLSDRDSLPKDAGMLFVVAKDTQPIFFMRKMKFPLDIIWINDGKIIGFSENLLPPPPDTPEDKLIQYKAPLPVDYVLEVNANLVKENNITTDTKIELPKKIQ